LVELKLNHQLVLMIMLTSMWQQTINTNKHLCSIELGSNKCNFETAEIRRKTWQLLSRHCQNWNSHTSKIGYLLPVCHRNNSWL